jgi:MFS family permease
MLDNLLFYTVFISQIFIISIYYPRQLANRMSYVSNNFPPSEYPKLYPESLNRVTIKRKIFITLNVVIALSGLVLMLLVMPFWESDAVDYNKIDSIPLMYGMVQFIPIMFLELTSFKLLKLMRETDNKTNRSASLTPRRLFDFVSPILLFTAIILAISFPILEWFLNDLELTNHLISQGIALFFVNALFVCLGTWNLYGKKQDPYQSPKDRIKQINMSLNSMIYVSILVSVFFGLTSIVNRLEWVELEVLINSLYFQLVAILGLGTMLRTIKVQDIDFSVYKSEA